MCLSASLQCNLLHHSQMISELYFHEFQIYAAVYDMQFLWS